MTKPEPTEKASGGFVARVGEGEEPVRVLSMEESINERLERFRRCARTTVGRCNGHAEFVGVRLVDKRMHGHVTDERTARAVPNGDLEPGTGL